MMSNNTAYLVGFMGSGKSSILQLIQEKQNSTQLIWMT